ncbi:MAG: Transposase IS200 like protein [candidate division WS6 bacterium OLB20]|uniref:Transposase IS200 like protein n=1 Tax=candidate division WS6 bacterium OLB20 TaxID=1617426 RepID=A0A136M0X0_9BACT|nr:MAG: Transposase IS200 like protein [candidate division WS6 bacterium OLB20]
MLNRKVFKNGIYHVYNRGNKKQPIFLDDRDYERFLDRLDTFRRQTRDQIAQYCLLPNHYHLIVKASGMYSISRLIKKLQTSHSMYMNWKYGFVGSFFQQRFKSKLVGTDIQLKVLSRYVHRNPIEFFGDPTVLQSYPYSSYNSFVSGIFRDNPITGSSKKLVLGYFASVSEYEEFVRADELIVQSELRNQVMSIQGL